MYCGREWSSKLQLFDHKFKGCSDGRVDLKPNKPISILMFPNLANVQLLKKLKWQIKNNDVSFIHLKLRIQVEVDAKKTLKKAPINGEHIHVQVCRFKSLKGYCQNLITINNVKKLHQKIQDKRWQNQKGGHHLKGDMQVHRASIS